LLEKYLYIRFGNFITFKNMGGQSLPKHPYPIVVPMYTRLTTRRRRRRRRRKLMTGILYTYCHLFGAPERTGAVVHDCCRRTGTGRTRTLFRRPRSTCHRVWHRSCRNQAWRSLGWTPRPSAGTASVRAGSQPPDTAGVDGSGGRVDRTAAQTPARTVDCPRTSPSGPACENRTPFKCIIIINLL